MQNNVGAISHLVMNVTVTIAPLSLSFSLPLTNRQMRASVWPQQLSLIKKKFRTRVFPKDTDVDWRHWGTNHHPMWLVDSTS